MSLAWLIMRGRALKARLAVNGIQNGSRSLGIPAFACVWDCAMTYYTALLNDAPLISKPHHGRQAQKAAKTEGPPAAWAGRSRPGRNRRHAGDGGNDSPAIRTLRLRAGGNAGDRIHRRARQISARPGPAERRRVLFSGR